MTPERLTKLFLMNSHLRTHGGHPYTETIGWIRLAREHGVDLRIFASTYAHPDLLEELDATPLFGQDVTDSDRYMTREQLASGHAPDLQALTEFMLRTDQTRRGCMGAWSGEATPPQAVVFSWADEAVLNGAAEWLCELAPAERPKLVFNFGHFPNWRADADRTQVSGDFTRFRFAARRVRALSRPEDLLFTVTDPRMCRVVAQLTDGPCSQTPNHAYYPTQAELDALRPTVTPTSPTISIMGPVRDEKGASLLARIVGGVSAALPEVTFFIQTIDLEQAYSMSQDLVATAGSGKVDLQPSPLPTPRYFERILASDLLLLPYTPEYYAMRSSGVFCEGVVCGVPMVVPRATWMGDRVAEGWGAGEMFDRAEPDDVVAAILRAMRRLPELQARAAGQGPAWRKVHSIDAYWEQVFAELSLTADPVVEPAARPGSATADGAAVQLGGRPHLLEQGLDIAIKE
jgi:hypothetical protein